MELASAEEQEQILSEAKSQIKRSVYHVRKAIDEDNMKEALRYSAAMLGELRTSLLSPQKYYELYMLIFDQMVNLEAFFGEERSKGRLYADLYELVQHAGNVLPRLYLMVAVGCLYIKSKEAMAKDILKDLVEMCKGVQHPTRGLFLRSYLCQRSRGVLPDTGSDYEGPGGDVNDALDFLLSNFIEMNKLWVRMQYQGNARDKERRERERQQLQDLVGKNLTYLSQLDGLNFELYSGRVLPRLMEQIISCKDDIAQQYLMQCVIQCFPDAFHLGTLDMLLDGLPQLQPGVKVHTVLASLMDRLAKYAQSDAAAMQKLLEMRAFERFRDNIDRVLTAQGSMPSAEAVEMYVALMGFTGSVLPNIVENVNQVLAAAHKALCNRGLAGDSRAEKQLVALLTIPLTKYDVVTGLGLSEYPLLMGLLCRRTHKELAARIVQSVLSAGTRIMSVEKALMLFRFISPLMQDAAPPPPGTSDAPATFEDPPDAEEIAEEQMMVSKLLHNLGCDDIDTHWEILKVTRENLMMGGAIRVRHTLPAFCFCLLALVRRLTLQGLSEVEKAKDGISGTQVMEAKGEENGEAAEKGEVPLGEVEMTKTAEPRPATVTTETLLQYLLQTCGMLVEVSEPMMALRLLLAGAYSASEEAGIEMLSYDFFEQAFTMFEDELSDQRQRMTALQAIVGTLQRCYIFSSENRDALVQSASGYASKLLHRGDQCRAVCACSHLSWQSDPPASATSTSRQPPVRDSTRVMSSLSRARKIAQAAKQQLTATARRGDTSHIGMYVEIMNHYLYYMDQGADKFTSTAVQQLIELIEEHVSAANAAPPPDSASMIPGVAPKTADVSGLRYWANTRQFIEQKKGAKDSSSEANSKYASLVLAPASTP